MTPRVLVADIQELFSSAVGEALQARGFAVVGQRPDSGPDVVRVVGDCRPDVTVVDAWLPHVGAPAVVRMIHERAPGCAVVVVSGFYNPAHITQVMAEGAAAYVPKTVNMDYLVEVIRRAHAGERPVDVDGVTETLQATLTRRMDADRVGWDRLMTLSNREIDVLVLLDKGHDNTEIAKELGVTKKTVANHVQRMLAKTGAQSRNQLLAMARDQAFISPSPYPWRRVRQRPETR